MSLPTQPGAYLDCYEIWDTAIRQLSAGGCRTNVGPNYSKAEYLRMRMHQARALRRSEARRAYPPGHPLWGTSDYDQLKITFKIDDDSNYWLYVEPHGNWSAVSAVEPIPADERIAPVLSQPQSPPQPRALPAPAPTPALDDELE